MLPTEKSVAVDNALAKPLRKWGVDHGIALLVRIDQQCLYLFVDARLCQQYPISSSRYGVGCRQDSLQTPLGLHDIAAKIGADQAPGTCFVGRQPQPPENPPGDDPITSRILWLRGLEAGYNRGLDCDTEQRYIYIHGTPEQSALGRPASQGCIRMADDDIIGLYPEVAVGTPVLIIRDGDG